MPDAAAGPLPAGWRQHHDAASGNLYYATSGGKVQWERPTEAAPDDGRGNLGRVLALAQLMQQNPAVQQLVMLAQLEVSLGMAGVKAAQQQQQQQHDRVVCHNCGAAGHYSRHCRHEKSCAWVCDCGFRNRAANLVCGGTGPIGCKARRPDAGERRARSPAGAGAKRGRSPPAAAAAAEAGLPSGGKRERSLSAAGAGTAEAEPKRGRFERTSESEGSERR